METISKKLEHELCRLYDAYAAGSLGVLYYPAAGDDTLPKKAFIRVKRLTKLGYAEYFGETIGHPVYKITAYGITTYRMVFGV